MKICFVDVYQSGIISIFSVCILIIVKSFNLCLRLYRYHSKHLETKCTCMHTHKHGDTYINMHKLIFHSHCIFLYPPPHPTHMHIYMYTHICPHTLMHISVHSQTFHFLMSDGTFLHGNKAVVF